MKRFPAKRSASLPDSSGVSLSRTKRRIFLFAIFSLPALFFLGLELLLRGIHYGPNLDIFVTEQIGGTTYHVMNPDVKGRYFSRIAFTPNTSPDYFQVPKPAKTFRIVCLGGSTTVGFPYGYVGSFSTFLRDRLNEIFPNRRIEVINLGMTATNSTTVLDIARELFDYEPDLILVYDGHNEFYGALGVASHETIGGSRFLIQLYLKLVHFRTFLFVRSVVQSVQAAFSSPPSTQSGTMMEQVARGQSVPWGSPTYFRGLKLFQSNLEELVQLCADHRVPLVLSTQVSNLRDLAPFISAFRNDVTPDERSQFKQLYMRAESDRIQGRLSAARDGYLRCLLLDSTRADAHFGLARCQDSLGQYRLALQEYIAARDYDQLRFRTSSDFNNLMTNASTRRGVYCADIEKIFKLSSPSSLIGYNIILEHLHPTVRGQFLMAQEYARIFRVQEFIASREEWQRADTLNNEHFWNARTLTEVDERAARLRIAILTSGWPFRAGEARTPAFDPPDTLSAIVEDLVNGRSTWERAHVTAAEYFEQRGDIEKAPAEYRVVMNQLPLNVSAYFRLAVLAARQRQFDEARVVLRKSLQIEQSVFAYQMLGQIALQQGEPEAAAASLDTAFTISRSVDERANTGYLLAIAYIRAGEPQRALAPLQHILSIKPQFREARALLEQLQRKH